MMTRFCRFLKASGLQIVDFFSRLLQLGCFSLPRKIKHTQHNVGDSMVCCCRCAYGGARVYFCVRGARAGLAAPSPLYITLDWNAYSQSLHC